MKKGIHFLFGALDGVDDFRATIDRFAAVGFDCIELPPEPFLSEKCAARELVVYAEDRGMEIVFSCGFAPEYDMASDNPAVRLQGVAHMRKILSLMEYAGIPLLAGTSYTKWPSLRTEPLTLAQKKALTERTAETFASAVSSIQERGIEIALEPLNRFEGFLINTAAEGVAFCNLVENPNVGLMLDGFHMSMEEDDLIAALEAAGRHLKHLHLAENNRRLPGLGAFPWSAFFAKLKQIGYSGRLDIESFMTPGGGIAASVALWRDLGLRDETAMLRESLSFIEKRCQSAGLI